MRFVMEANAWKLFECMTVLVWVKFSPFLVLSFERELNVSPSVFAV
jgi:hypothetical protein